MSSDDRGNSPYIPEGFWKDIEQVGTGLELRGEYLSDIAEKWNDEDMEVIQDFTEISDSMANTANGFYEGVNVLRDVWDSAPETSRVSLIEKINQRLEGEIESIEEDYENLRENVEETYELITSSLAEKANEVGISLEFPEDDSCYDVEEVLESLHEAEHRFSNRAQELEQRSKTAEQREEQLHREAERFLDRGVETYDKFGDVYEDLAEEIADRAQGERARASVGKLIDLSELAAKAANSFRRYMDDVYEVLETSEEIRDLTIEMNSLSDELLEYARDH